MTTARELRHIMQAIKRVLKRREHLHLLKPAWRKLHEQEKVPASTGFCSLAAEALYFTAGGKRSGLTPWRLRFPDNTTHWWLVDTQERVWDPTADQFRKEVPYHLGQPGGFPTPRQGRREQPPSRAAAELIEAVVEELQ